LICINILIPTLLLLLMTGRHHRQRS
jgi:hypothetical protein